MGMMINHMSAQKTFRRRFFLDAKIEGPSFIIGKSEVDVDIISIFLFRKFFYNSRFSNAPSSLDQQCAVFVRRVLPFKKLSINFSFESYVPPKLHFLNEADKLPRFANYQRTNLCVDCD